jgi:hypothetical protein
MVERAAPIAAPPVSAPPVVAAAPAPVVAGADLGNAALGLLADGGFVAKLGAGLRLAAADLQSQDGVDLSTLPQPLRGVRLNRATWQAKRNRLKIAASLAVPHLEAAEIEIHASKDGKVSFAVAKLQKRLQIAALGNPQVTLSLSEEGAFGGSVTISPSDLERGGPRGLSVTGGGTLTLQDGRFSGNVDATLAYAKLGSGEVHVAFNDEGRVTGSGTLRVTPPFLDEAKADLTLGEDGQLNGSVTVSMTEAVSPIPALSLTGGTLTVSYASGALSGSLTDFRASYRGLADVTASATIDNGKFSGKGNIDLTVPGLNEATGVVKLADGTVTGSLTLAANAFPKALPVKSGRIVATLAENGRIAFSGHVAVTLGPAGSGKLAAAYSETGELSLAATLDLTVPGLQQSQVSVAYVNGDLSGEAQLAIDPTLIPGLDGKATVRYQQGLWSGETEIGYAADNGKLSGRIRVTVKQTEAGALELGGSGQVEAQIAPRVRGMLTATLLPHGGVDVSGRIVVSEELLLFEEEKFDKELFKYSQNIPLWAILVAVIRVRAGVRGGVGKGVLRNITVEGSYTIGNDAADPTFTISGEMFIPAFIEAYVAFGAGLGLDVVLGSLTGGIEGVATAGIYGAVSVIPELSYADGDWSIEGTATLAAGARLKIGLNAWAEVEAFWVTVWEESWKLGEWVWNIGPDLALQAKMAYRFGQPGPPELDFKSSDIDAESMIQAAMPEDGPGPSGAKEALQNKAEWKGKLKEQKPAPLPAALAAQSQAAPPTPPQPAKQPKPKAGPPAGGAGAAPAPGQSSAQAAPAVAPAPGSAAAAQAAATAGTPDNSVKGAVAPSEVPTAGKPRYPAPISLATIDEPPAALPRTKEQEGEDVKAAEQAVKLVVAQATDTDALDDWFPRIKNRFRLVSLGFTGDLHSGIRIEGGVNPQIQMVGPPLVLKGTGVPGGAKTEIKHSSGVIDGTTVGISMIADPLGPDIKDGTPPSGQETLMEQMPTNPSEYRALNARFVRGHLLNHNVGGEGKPHNLFPITTRANIDHHKLVEKTVKQWIKKDHYWVRYKVDVISDGQLIPLKNGLNAVNATLKTEASCLDAKLRPVNSMPPQSISSQVDPALIAASPSPSPGASPPVPGTAQLVFNAEMYADLLDSHKLRGRDKTIERLLTFSGFGEKSQTALYKAYDEIAGKQDKSIHSLDTDEKATFRRVENRWSEIRNLIV